MKEYNIEKSIISVSSPGCYLKSGEDLLARNLARHVNEVAADLKKRRPDQFGFYATLPLPDVEGCLKEIPYALDTLNADGFVVMTNFGGRYLGHKDFDPIFDELEKRKAVVFMHPTTPCLPSGETAIPLPEFPRPMFEFLFDTARAVINLFLSGTVGRCPNVKFQVPHCGGTFPPLIDRFGNVASLLKLPGTDQKVSSAWVRERLNSQFYFDTAGWAFPEQIKGLLQYVTVDRILYGSDFPFTNFHAVGALSRDHDKYLSVQFPDKEDQEKLTRKNGLLLHAAQAKVKKQTE